MVHCSAAEHSRAQHPRERNISPNTFAQSVYIKLELEFFPSIFQKMISEEGSVEFVSQQVLEGTATEQKEFYTMQRINCCRIAIDEEIRSRCVALSTKNTKE